MHVSMSYHVDADTWVDLHAYGTERTPILGLTNIGQHLMISACGDLPLTDHLAFARQLADATARYVTAMETYAAAQTADSTEVA
ncbi:hypothetical protein ABH931_000681 [Streptacidiphilus sp. MAP12-33]|uniref:hypothetical protein n=1 Tax=Streptacidiphilus sp. MAP12-33 TaxID=3156266 RepID=UPI0035141BD7